MLEQYQQGGRGPLGGGENRQAPEKNHHKLVQNRLNHVDITKHKCRDIGLPDGMGVPNRQAPQEDGSTGTTLSDHCATASQALIFWRHKTHNFKKYITLNILCSTANTTLFFPLNF